MPTNTRHTLLLKISELAAREFVPEIQQIVSVTSFSTPCTWAVHTDHGETTFVLRGEEAIRRLGVGNSLLVADSHGIQYLVRDQTALDAPSKKILDRFLWQAKVSKYC